MSVEYDKINDYLIKIFNNILVIEENSLKNSRFSDVSLKEMHTIEAIGQTGKMTGSDIAKTLMITPPTVTISLNRLERKGYIVRKQSTTDRRVNYVGLTKKGNLVYSVHKKFHEALVKRCVKGSSVEEVEILSQGLKKLHEFLEDLKQ